MKKFALSLIALSTTLALTACGSSDGKIDLAKAKMNVSNLVQPVNPDSANSPTKIASDATEHYSGQYWHAYHHDKQPSKFTLHNSTLDASNLDNINKFTIGDKTFNLSTISNVEQLGDKIIGAKIGGTAHSRFGVAWRDLPGADDEDFAFYQGYQTLPKNMPTGKASYVGEAVHICSDCNHVSKSAFEVDFGAKTVKGVITNPDDSKVNLGATISGSSFSGMANGVQTNGAFYGHNAEELSGIYKEVNNNFGGAFGATKTK